MRTRKGFTLIELLVVIAVIAVLMSILVPALSEARKQAQATVCASTLHGWGSVMNMYLQDYKDKFWEDPSPDLAGAPRLWMNRLGDLYGNIDKFRLCASAKQRNPSTNANAYGSSSVVYRNSGEVNGTQTTYEGSYGINHWLNDVTMSGPWAGGWRAQPERQWRKLPTEFLDEVPAILDCCWYGANPDNDPGMVGGSVPDENDWLYNCFTVGTSSGATSRHDMARFAIDRHKGAINGVFLDGSARRLPLVELWGLKWHRESIPASGAALVEVRAKLLTWTR